MRASGRKKIPSVILSLLVVTSLAIALVPGTASAAVTVQAIPRMVSIWRLGGPGLFPEPQFDTGPGSTTLIINAPAPPASAPTLNLKSVFDQLFPTAASRIALFPQAMQDAYNAKMDSLTAIPFTWNAALGVWTHELGTEEAITEPSATARAVAETVLFQEARLGDVTVPVKVGATTYSTKVTVVDMQRPLLPGWTAISTPAALGVSRWGAIASMGGGISYDAAVRWDAASRVWRMFSTANTLEPVDAVYVHTVGFNTVGLIFSRAVSSPRSVLLWAGWNAIGLADIRGKDGAGADSYFEMPADQALQSTSPDLAAVISPGESWSYTQHFTYSDTDIGTHNWDFNQDSWVWAAEDPAPPQMTTGGVYWVYMNQDGALGGLSQTPVRLSSWNPF